MYYENNSKMPPNSEKTSILTKFVAAIFLFLIILGAYFLVKKCNEIKDDYKSKLEEEEKEELKVSSRLQLQQTAKEIVEKTSNIDIGEEEVIAFACGGENKNEVILFNLFNYQYSDIIIINKLIFNDEVRPGIINIMDSITNKEYKTEEIYSGSRYNIKTGYKILENISNDESSKLRKLVEEGYSYSIKFIGLNYKYSAVRKEYTLEFRFFIILSKDNNKKFIDLFCTTKSNQLSIDSTILNLSFIEGKITYYSDDIFESFKMN